MAWRIGRGGAQAGLVLVDGREDLVRGGETLSAENVTYIYPGARTPTLACVSARVPRTGLSCIRGRHEAGKSTLGQLLSGTLIPSGGNLHVDGEIVDDHVALLTFPPSDRWPEEWTSTEFLTDGFLEAGFISDSVATRLAQATLREGGLGDVADAQRPALRHVDRARVATLHRLIDLPSWLVVDDLDNKLDRDDLRELMDFVSTCADVCRVGVIWLTTSVQVMLAADQSWTLNDGIMIRAA